MKDDRTELHDLSFQKPQLLQTLVAKYDDWYQKAGAKPYFKKPMEWQSSIVETLKNNQK